MQNRMRGRDYSPATDAGPQSIYGGERDGGCCVTAVVIAIAVTAGVVFINQAIELWERLG